MANIKLTQLPVTSTVAPADLLMVVRTTDAIAANHQISILNLLSNLTSSVTVNPSFESAIYLKVNGSLGSTLLKTDPSTNRVGINTNTPLSTLHVNGSVRVDGYFSDSSEIVDFVNDLTPAINLSKTITGFVLDAEVYNIDISDGAASGQEKDLFINAIGSGGRVVVNAVTSNGCGWTTLTFDKEGSAAVLKWAGQPGSERWVLMSVNGVAVV